MTLARLWQSDRDGLQGVFLQAIARLLPRKTTQQAACQRVGAPLSNHCRTSARSASSMPVALFIGMILLTTTCW